MAREINVFEDECRQRGGTFEQAKDRVSCTFDTETIEEEWCPRCVDDFEKFFGGQATKSEWEELRGIRNKIEDPELPQSEVNLLYDEAVGILHGVFIRCVSKERDIMSVDFKPREEDNLGISVIVVKKG